MKKLLTLISIFFVFIVSINFVNADTSFNEYNDKIISTAAKASAAGACENKCEDVIRDGVTTKYYQLTTGVPFLGSNAKKCACIPVNSGMQFFLTAILKFILGSVATLATIIIIIAGFMWSFSAGNKNTIVKAQKMISDAVIGLVMTLTCGLMLQVINPNLLEVKILKIDNINIKPVEYGKEGGLAVGSRCLVNAEKPCNIGLKCVALSKCNDSLEGTTAPKFGNNDGICVSKDLALACLNETCNKQSFYCMHTFIANNNKQLSCINGKCVFPTGEVDTSKPKVGKGSLCGDSADGVACQDIYTCLNVDGSDTDLYRCYPKSCTVVRAKGDTGNPCDGVTMCCAGSVCHTEDTYPSCY